MTPEELQKLAGEIAAEMISKGPLALGGVSIGDAGRIFTTGCVCDGKCGCNERCGCQDKQGCGCNDRCPCDAKAVPAKSGWVINPDPSATRVYLNLDVSGPVETIVETLRKVRAGLRVQSGQQIDEPIQPAAPNEQSSANGSDRGS